MVNVYFVVRLPLEKKQMKLLFIVSFSLVVGHIGSVSVLIPCRGWSLLLMKEHCLHGGGYGDDEHLPNGPPNSQLTVQMRYNNS